MIAPAEGCKGEGGVEASEEASGNPISSKAKVSGHAVFGGTYRECCRAAEV
jgi:hypothetical protein